MFRCVDNEAETYAVVAVAVSMETTRHRLRRVLVTFLCTVAKFFLNSPIVESGLEIIEGIK
jgi:hypothetical protein